MNDILNLIDPTNYTVGNKYNYDGVNVPRVTEILSAMLHEDYLMEWSNNIGLYQHKKYKETLDRSGNIGTLVHDSIERYLSENIIFNKDNYPVDITIPVSTAFNSFLEWWSIIKKTNYRILMQEKELVCKYFGGTLDLLMEINGKIYIVDFKTSNYPSYKYFLQLSAYRYILKEEYNTEIDGCIILMLNKKKCKFTELILDLHIEEDLVYINHSRDTFLSLVYSYYNRMIAQSMYENKFGRK